MTQAYCYGCKYQDKYWAIVTNMATQQCNSWAGYKAHFTFLSSAMFLWTQIILQTYCKILIHIFSLITEINCKGRFSISKATNIYQIENLSLLIINTISQVLNASDNISRHINGYDFFPLTFLYDWFNGIFVTLKKDIFLFFEKFFVNKIRWMLKIQIY